jgi:phosphatidylserine/phosphatidylglycerophosphate/cardiolipin synthase-like enzyme
VNECSPDYWFLGLSEQVGIPDRAAMKSVDIPKDQLLPGRGAGWRTQNEVWGLSTENLLISSYTTGNKVTAFVDGDSYTTSLLRDLTALTGRSGNFALFTGWQFTNSFKLSNTDKLSDTIDALAQRNVPVRALAFDNPIPLLGNGPFVDAVNRAYPPAGTPPLRSGQLDKAVGGFAFSHHQKEVFLGTTNPNLKNSAYVGGIDLANDRWDTATHRKTAKDFEFFGWHDVQVKVEGDALYALWANFAERWDSANRVLGKATNPAYRLAPCPVPVLNDLNPGTHNVQVLRTVAEAASSDPDRFMPNGEMTVLAGLAKAIRKAECYIYIEEQYLWDCELADLIAQQLKDKPGLRLIVVLAAESSLLPVMWTYNFHLRSEFLRRVMGVATKADIAFGPKTRVYVYGLYQTLEKAPKAVYVHSKLIIIDDRYVAIGSANVDRRSMRIETELTLGIVDATTVASTLNGQAATVCKFAKELRERLWKEHLNFIGTLPDDPIDALKNFPEGVVSPWTANSTYTWPTNQKKSKKSAKFHMRCYVNIPGSDNVPVAIKRTLDRGELRWRSTSGA